MVLVGVGLGFCAADAALAAATALAAALAGFFFLFEGGDFCATPKPPFMAKDAAPRTAAGERSSGRADRVNHVSRKEALKVPQYSNGRCWHYSTILGRNPVVQAAVESLNRVIDVVNKYSSRWLRRPARLLLQGRVVTLRKHVCWRENLDSRNHPFSNGCAVGVTSSYFCCWI